MPGRGRRCAQVGAAVIFGDPATVDRWYAFSDAECTAPPDLG